MLSRIFSRLKELTQAGGSGGTRVIVALAPKEDEQALSRILRWLAVKGLRPDETLEAASADEAIQAISNLKGRIVVVTTSSMAKTLGEWARSRGGGIVVIDVDSKAPGMQMGC
ncbi:hypothetical protein [Aeropyrum camini]|uniref:ABC-type nitrate/sulfonate/bicarbonate transporter n=1 Tax=Aeropyrum camini SY1 = JCM 12091 TaxID=1198449 RepID=U3TG87_9CREN|nr:hypothetical protein [Aeropyrum camini]BAN91013.1 ABC-type nitrate/sulfonate/bicarbonate transporter [Aeropyrum camini SY1 = JCM 12091]